MLIRMGMLRIGGQVVRGMIRFVRDALLKKERETRTGDKIRPANGIDSSSMRTDKLTNRMAFAALGAFAAYVGFCVTDAGHFPSVLPMLFALGMALTGLALIVKSGRRVAPPRAEPFQSQSLPSSSRASGEAVQADAALLGHEIKNYVCTLKGNARLLRERSRGLDGDIIDRIDRVVEKLESFTRNMTSTINATSSGVLWNLDMGRAAQSCVSTHFHGAEDAFRWNILPDSPVLLGDPNRLEQVFLNLFTNAREAGAQRVTTSVARNGERLQVFIEDDGNGCAPEDLARIFEPFFSTKCGPARRGLGMFIVQSIVENHGGSIKVRSKNGSGDGAHGLVFLLDFPISLPAPSLAPFPAPLSAALSVHEADHPAALEARTPREQPVLRSQEWLMAVPGPF
jgi:signal transduction histidine kinase